MKRSAREASVTASTVTTIDDDDGGESNGKICGSGGGGGAKKMRITVENIRVPNIDYTVQRDAPLARLMFEYCQHMGISYKEWKFTYLGKQIKDFDTPNLLQMEESDVIDCWPQFTGAGSGSGSGSTTN